MPASSTRADGSDKLITHSEMDPLPGFAASGAPHPLRATIENWAPGTRGAAAPVQSVHSAALAESCFRNWRDGTKET